MKKIIIALFMIACCSTLFPKNMELPSSDAQSSDAQHFSENLQIPGIPVSLQQAIVASRDQQGVESLHQAFIAHRQHLQHQPQTQTVNVARSSTPFPVAAIAQPTNTPTRTPQPTSSLARTPQPTNVLNSSAPRDFTTTVRETRNNRPGHFTVITMPRRQLRLLAEEQMRNLRGRIESSRLLRSAIRNERVRLEEILNNREQQFEHTTEHDNHDND